MSEIDGGGEGTDATPEPEPEPIGETEVEGAGADEIESGGEPLDTTSFDDGAGGGGTGGTGSDVAELPEEGPNDLAASLPSEARAAVLESGKAFNDAGVTYGESTSEAELGGLHAYRVGELAGSDDSVDHGHVLNDAGVAYGDPVSTNDKPPDTNAGAMSAVEASPAPLDDTAAAIYGDQQTVSVEQRSTEVTTETTVEHSTQMRDGVEHEIRTETTQTVTADATTTTDATYGADSFYGNGDNITTTVTYSEQVETSQESEVVRVTLPSEDPYQF